MSKPHGALAIDALQKGDMNEAVNQIQAGYGWLADGHHIERRGNILDVVDHNGNVTHSIPASPQYLKNVATGMMTGEFGHDIYRGRAEAGQPPPTQTGAPAGPSGSPRPVQAGGPPAMPPGREPWDEKIDPNDPGVPIDGSPRRPAAQPSTATAGPATPPKAAVPPAAGPPAGPPAAPSGAISTAPSTGAPPAGAPPAAAPAPAPAKPAPSTAPVIETKPAAPPPAQVTPTGKTETPAEVTQGPYDAPAVPQGQRPPVYRHVTEEPNNSMQITIPSLGAAGNQKPIVVDVDTAERQLGRFFQQKRAEIMKETDKLPKNEKWVRDQRLKGLDKEQADLMRQVNERRAERERARTAADTAERRHLTPHSPNSDEQTKWESNWAGQATRLRDTAKKDPSSEAASILPASPMRYLTEPGQDRPMLDIARAIKVHNNSRLSEQQAYDVMLNITRHVPDETTVGGKKVKVDPKDVPNGHTGEKGAYFKRLPNDVNGNVVLQTTNGVISMPKDTFAAVVKMKHQSYTQAKKEQADAAKTNAERKADAPKALDLIVPKKAPESPITGEGYGYGAGV
jgi:hypothetical protein